MFGCAEVSEGVRSCFIHSLANKTSIVKSLLFPLCPKKIFKVVRAMMLPSLLPTFVFLDLLFQCLLSFPYVLTEARLWGSSYNYFIYDV